MERIDFHGGFFTVPSKPQDRKKGASKSDKTGKSFLSIVSGDADENRGPCETAAPGDPASAAGDMETLLDRVHELGERLKEDPTLRTVGEYRSAVRNFLQIVVDSCYKVEERAGSKSILRQKKFTQIRIVDDKLERLAAGVMSSQRDQLEILRRVDEIHGILIDLLS